MGYLSQQLIRQVKIYYYFYYLATFNILLNISGLQEPHFFFFKFSLSTLSSSVHFSLRKTHITSNLPLSFLGHPFLLLPPPPLLQVLVFSATSLSLPSLASLYPAHFSLTQVYSFFFFNLSNYPGLFSSCFIASHFKNPKQLPIS